nr:MAG: Sporulation protein [Bacteriophage sp.]
MQWLRRFIAKNPAKVFRDEPGTMINMRCKTMKRKVKFFDKLYDTDTLDEEINAWIEGYNKELIDVRLTADWEDGNDYIKYTATVIYGDRTEG